MLLFRTSKRIKAHSKAWKIPLIALVLMVFAESAFSQTSTPTTTPTPSDEQVSLETVEPAEAIRGEVVTLTGTIPKKPVEIAVELKSLDSGQNVRVVSENVSIVEDGQTFAFTIPNSARLGKYEVSVTFTKGGKTWTCDGPPVGRGGVQNHNR